MQTIHIQIADQIHVIYVARQMTYQITMNPDRTHRRFRNIRQFWAHVERECQTLGSVKTEPCVLKRLAREMVKHVSKPVEEAERAEWLARFDADDLRANQPPKPVTYRGEPSRPCDCKTYDEVRDECTDQNCPNFIPF